MSKIIRNSLLSIIVGIVLSIVSIHCMEMAEPINYVGAMFVFGGMIFVDRMVIEKIFDKKQASKLSIVRLPVYMFIGVLCLMLPGHMSVSLYADKILRSFGIAFLLLALWRFFTFTTVKQQEIHSK